MEWFAVLAFAAGGLFNAALAEWRARAAEGRAARQRAGEWKRHEEADRRTRLRDAVVRDLQETRAYFLAQEAWLLARTEGRATAYPGPDYPNQDLSMTGDAGLIGDWAQTVTELMEVEPGAGLPRTLGVKAASVHARVMRALKDQEARALADQPLAEVAVDDLEVMYNMQATLEKIAGI